MRTGAGHRGRGAAILAAGTLGLLPACSGSPSPHVASSTTTRPKTTVPTVAACTPSSVSASVAFTKFGGTSSSLAGAVLFADTGTSSCSLRGVPTVTVLGPGAEPIPTFEAPTGTAGGAAAVLTPSTAAGPGDRGGASITFSSWTCATTSLSFTVSFPGWATPVPAAPTASSGNNSPTPCSASDEADQTLYIGPVTTLSS